MHRFAAVVIGLLVVTSITQSGQDAPAPPKGWKEFTPQDRSFTVWIPENPKRQVEREKTSVIRAQRIKITLLHIKLADRAIYHVERIALPATIYTKIKRKELEASLKEMLLAEFPNSVESSPRNRMPSSLTGRSERSTLSRRVKA